RLGGRGAGLADLGRIAVGAGHRPRVVAGRGGGAGGVGVRRRAGRRWVELAEAAGRAMVRARDRARRARARPGGAGPMIGEELPARGAIRQLHALERRPALAVVVVGGEVGRVVDVELVVVARVEARHRAAADDVLVPVAEVLAERYALVERGLEEVPWADELGRIRHREVEAR